jgi:pimeloyl-ACP methyl ester carboxylesterase
MAPSGSDHALPFSKTRSDFVSSGVRCSGDLYIPQGVERPPAVILAHGLGADRAFGLSNYAEYFVKTGIASYVFDYRGFGDSDGEVRHLVSPKRHLEDWRAAIAHVRSLPRINSTRIGLWGSSFSGGHVIATAACIRDITAIAAQVPFVDPFSTLKMLGLRFLLRATPHALRDLARMITFRKPYYIKTVGDETEFAVLATHETRQYLDLIPEGYEWANECAARILLTFTLYRPLSVSAKVACPALVIYGTRDSLISPDSVKDAAHRMHRSEVIEYDAGHFEVYFGKLFSEIVAKQASFFKTHLFA